MARLAEINVINSFFRSAVFSVKADRFCCASLILLRCWPDFFRITEETVSMRAFSPSIFCAFWSYFSFKALNVLIASWITTISSSSSFFFVIALIWVTMFSNCSAISENGVLFPFPWPILFTKVKLSASVSLINTGNVVSFFSCESNWNFFLK